MRRVRFPYEALLGRRVMVTTEIPTLGEKVRFLRDSPAIVQQENSAFALQGSGCDSPSLHQITTHDTRGAVAQTGERLDGIEKVAGAIPVSSTASNAGEDYITIMVLR
jgi:hypothetical protein